jgi:hypothetical protein
MRSLDGRSAMPPPKVESSHEEGDKSGGAGFGDGWGMRDTCGERF